MNEGRTPPFLPYGRQAVTEEDIAAVSKVLRGDWLTTGPTVSAFEEAFAERVGARYAVSCSSGTAALHLAVLAAGAGPGDRAVVPTMTFLATANAARYVGAEVVFSDVDAETGLMGVEHIRACLDGLDPADASAAKLVLPVHFAGQTADMEPIAALAKEHSLVVIEDACHAVGTTYATEDGGQHVVGGCRHSDMAVFSFHPVKTITTGEGGMVTTNDPGLHGKLARFRNHGLSRDVAEFRHRDRALDGTGEPNPWYYEMTEPGFNYRLTDIHAALGLSQLDKLDGFVARRREIVARMDDALASLAPRVRPMHRVPRCVPAWHLYVVLIDYAAIGLERAAVMAALRERGVGSQVHYQPVHLQPYYRERYGDISCPGAERWYDAALSLPLFPTMSDADADRIVRCLFEITT